MATANPQTSRPLMPLGSLALLTALILGIAGAIYLWDHEARSRILVPVTAHGLPAYHQIQGNDLIQREYISKDLASTVVRDSTQPVGRYTLAAIPQNQLLTEDQLGPKVEAALISGTVAVGLTATPSMIMGGSIHAGDVIDFVFVHVVSDTPTTSATKIFASLLILDVKPVQTSESKTEPPFVLVTAVPADKRDEFVAHLATDKLFLTRRSTP